MEDYLLRFNTNLENYGFNNGNFSQRMYLMNLMLFESGEKVGDVDFSTFTVKDLKDVIGDLLEYQSDETSDPDCDGECINMGNPLYELNVLAGINRDVLKIKPQRTKIRRFY